MMLVSLNGRADHRQQQHVPLYVRVKRGCVVNPGSLYTFHNVLDLAHLRCAAPAGDDVRPVRHHGGAQAGQERELVVARSALTAGRSALRPTTISC
ncbi:MAG: hypothetical protein U0703_13870 [Anaerolineae bacterium]